MIIVPALNEEGSVGEVVKEIQGVMPGVPVLVLDDCSTDATAAVARAAGAEILLVIDWHSNLDSTMSFAWTATGSTIRRTSRACSRRCARAAARW
jgi:glycosyltransferase involved in cell wall biosynthesis